MWREELWKGRDEGGKELCEQGGGGRGSGMDNLDYQARHSTVCRY